MPQPGPENEEDVRVVLVDDDPLLCDTLKLTLELDGYTVWTAITASEAMGLIQQHQPHCVITDLNMPDVNGIELAKRVRAACDPGMVLIVLTGSDATADHALVEQAGADYVLLKPLDEARLRSMLPPIG